MKNILIKIQYDGKNFEGWQVQPNKRTVQGVLEEALSELLREKITLFASGRTDSGVHAIAQTAHFDTMSDFDIKKLPLALQSKLPEDVAVIHAKEVDQNFHARFDVKKKTYLYRLYKSDVELPLFRGRALRVSPKIDVEKIKKATTALVGTHDFSAFCSANSSAKDFVRTIFDIKIQENGDQIDIFVTGNGFLYNMVRIIVGTLIDIGNDKIPTDALPQILSSKDRTLAGKTAKPFGLYLFDVEY